MQCGAHLIGAEQANEEVAMGPIGGPMVTRKMAGKCLVAKEGARRTVSGAVYGFGGGGKRGLFPRVEVLEGDSRRRGCRVFCPFERLCLRSRSQILAQLPTILSYRERRKLGFVGLAVRDKSYSRG
ncbi:hypothetical protein NE237_019760 [Protea cynaroides]|uniref:Uncharacterized protein n=1 Tax=Protea cynaroides TaxID=273540 RepID=A0A9Q0H5Y6_9MAGN|nr:hypothetical protein NE237_019760 [Protea cynaroides]